jgi:ABC-type xylose transport system permease subunit
MAVSPEVKYVTRGVVLALAVWLDVRLSRAGGAAAVGVA